jgi:hypothetical protein
MVNIVPEMSLTDLVFHTFASCGKEQVVLKKAANKPIIVINSIFLIPLEASNA